MSYLLLDHWDAIELFARVISKYEKLPLKQFQNNILLTRKLKAYKKKDISLAVSIAIFGLKKIQRNTKDGLITEEVPVRPKGFYELNRMIRYSIPVTLDEDAFDEYLNYIDTKGFSFNANKLKEWTPSDKQRRFESTRWLLYYYHQENIKYENNKTKLASGIARSVLKMNVFGKAELVSYKESEDYVGKFNIYDKEEKFLLLEMKLKGSKQKDLHILFYIGTSDIPIIEIALGEFHNLGRSIYSGTIMIEPITSKYAKTVKPSFFQGDNIKNLPDYVQLYFKEKRKNILRVPCKVTSIDDFYEWHGGKNPLN